MKTRINSNYNKKVLVSGNSISDVNTLTENEMMLYTKQKDNEPVTKVVPQKIITKINGETKSYKVGGTKIIKNVGTSLVTSFRDKDVYPIYIHSINKLPNLTIRNYEYNGITLKHYDADYKICINSLLKKKIKRFYLLFFIPDIPDFGRFSLSCYVEVNNNTLLSTILHYQYSHVDHIRYLDHSYLLWEIDITSINNIIVKRASNRDIAANDCFTLDGTYYFYSPQKHQYLTLDTRFTENKFYNSFYLFEGLVDLDSIYGEGWVSPKLYIPIGKIRKNNHCIRILRCDITVPPSEDWEGEAAPLIEDKLNYRNNSIKGFLVLGKPTVIVDFRESMPSLDISHIDKLRYYEGIEFRLYPNSNNENYHLVMEKTIKVIDVIP